MSSKPAAVRRASGPRPSISEMNSRIVFGGTTSAPVVMDGRAKPYGLERDDTPDCRAGGPHRAGIGRTGSGGGSRLTRIGRTGRGVVAAESGDPDDATVNRREALADLRVVAGDDQPLGAGQRLDRLEGREHLGEVGEDLDRLALLDVTVEV
jgi:hypothetical protein